MVLVMVALPQASSDIFVPSLPMMQVSLNASTQGMQLTISLYLIIAGLAQLIYGPWSDLFGRKAPLCFGLIIFILGSLLAIFSSSLNHLLFARALQALGITAASVLYKPILSDCFSGKELALKANYSSCVWGAGPIIAPVLGGYIQYYLGWQYSFAFLALFGSACFIFCLVFFQDTLAPQDKLKNKKLKNITSGLANLFASRQFYTGLLMMIAGLSTVISFNIMGTFIIQQQWQYSPIIFGYVALGAGCIFFTGTFINRNLIKYHSVSLSNQVASALLFLSSLTVICLDFFQITSPLLLSLACGIAFSAHATIYPNGMSMILDEHRQVGGKVSSIVGFIVISCVGLISLLESHLDQTSLFALGISFLASFILALIACLLSQKTLSK